MRDSEPGRRSAPRFGLAVTVSMEGLPCACHDISASGLLLETPHAAAPGTWVRLRLQHDCGGALGRDLRCSGRVVRSERRGDSWNVAVRLDQPLFDPAGLGEEGTG